jgi:hypothetical protein
MRGSLNARTLGSLVALVLLVVLADPALAQMAQRPFAVAGGEGGGRAAGITGWLLSQTACFTLPGRVTARL